MTEEKLRSTIANRLGQVNVSDLMWSALDDLGHVRDALDVGEPGVEDLVEAARSLRPYVERMGAGPSRSEPRNTGNDLAGSKGGGGDHRGPG